jgi:hypothetical protein
MKYDDHCLECEIALGKPFGEVHKWLDELMHEPGLFLEYKTRHRRFRHTLEGIEQVRKMWGDESAKAAELHIISDLKMDGWNESEGIPKNTEDYIKRDLW